MAEGDVPQPPVRAAMRSGQLSAAHRGYAYQDLVAAYLLVRSLVDRSDSVVVDRKIVDDDRFDDIEVVGSGTRLRVQLKSSEDLSASLTYADFNAANSSLRFDRLVKTWTAEGSQAAHEYRLCATWQLPASTDPLAAFLAASTAQGIFGSFSTRTFQLSADAVWPADGEPVFTPLRQAPDGTYALTRDTVVRFCQRFVIELCLPPASLDLTVPGALERLLLALLTDQVGIGRYPNADRDVADVAARAIHLASVARIGGTTLQPSDVSRALILRTDFGRIAQAFPIDRTVLQERLPLRGRLREAIAAGGIHLVLAGPGAGKSWALTQLAEDLSQEGVVVARHYCFLEPGDALVEQRVTTNVFFGNLIGELADAFTACGLAPPQRFAAGLEELEEFLAAHPDQRVVVIVDGLDHIARVRGTSAALRDNETDIVERLATLNVPANVTLVVGSQPGEHLQPLKDEFAARIEEHYVAPWPKSEMVGLARSHSVIDALTSAHIEGDRQALILDLFYERSEGSPLYGRYLSRGMVDGINSGGISDPLAWLAAAPAILGDIALYYRHLYESISNDAKAIADIVGVLEFSVNEAELREIAGPALSDWVPEALLAMAPVLSVATAQGGLRIFHESFRRFMLQELAHRGRRIAGVLVPVVSWLESRDFFRDAKSYRFTLTVMRRAGREGEILERVSTSFVQQSLLHGHPHDAIERNLELAADVAASKLDWPALVRCSELSRALDACFSQHANDWQEYWRTFLALFGVGALADSLLFDGRPTRSREEGLRACEQIDIAGFTAPWREYLALPAHQEETSYGRGEFNPFGHLQEDEQVALAIIRGRLRLGEPLRIVRRVHEHLFSSDVDITSQFLRELATLLATEISPQLVEQVVKRVDYAPPKRYILEKRFACALLLGLADAAAEEGDIKRAEERAMAALARATSPEEAVWCMERGAASNLTFAHAPEPSSLDISVEGDRGIVDAGSVRQWIASLRLLSRDVGSAGTILNNERARLKGVGWYRCWLRFVLASAEAEAAAAQGAPYDIKAAFAELVVDTKPFSGSPRACDLYSIHGLINESLRRALKLLRSTEEWEVAIAAITDARVGTATRLDREDGGPITAGALFSVLLDHVSTPAASALIVQTLEQELVDEERNGTYYSNHAEYRMRLARLHAQTANRTRALEHWNEASVFLLGYGFHKDIALFDVIDSVPALVSQSEEVALQALERLQPLVGAVLRHTDRRETRNAPNAWFRALLIASPTRAIELLCREYARELGQTSWIAERGHRDVLRHLRDRANPLVLDALWEALLLDIEYEGEGKKVADDRLHQLERLPETHQEYKRERFVRLSAEVFDDARSYRREAVATLQAFAQKHGLHLPWTAAVQEGGDQRAGGGRAIDDAEFASQQVQPSVFAASPRFVDILTALRRVQQLKIPGEHVDARVALPLSYLLTEMHDRGEEADARRLLHFFVHETPHWSYEKSHPIASLAQYLDNAGHQRLAAVALTLAFTSSRGGGGYLNFGGSAQTPLLRRAMQLDRELALQTLADETSRKVRAGGFNGITHHLIEQISAWGDSAAAAAAWEEAFRVLAGRLPLAPETGPLEVLDPHDSVSWSLDEALAAMLLSRIGNASLPRKIAALSGFTRLLVEQPGLLLAPLEWILTRHSTVSTVQIVLQVLLETPADISKLLTPLEEVLLAYARGNAWTLSFLAEKLLERNGSAIRTTRSRPCAMPGPLSPAGVALTRLADESNVLAALEEVWPELPAIICRRMEELAKDNEHFKHHLQERREIQFSRASGIVPAAALSWPTELFIAVLDESLMGLHEHLWSKGLWDSDVEDFVASEVISFAAVHLAVAASRVPRPNWPPASAAQDAVGDITKVPGEDKTYGGWVRLGLYEQSWFHSEGRDHLDPDRSVLVSAGLVCTEIDGSIPTQAIPIPPGHIASWWDDISEDEMRDEARIAQLVRLGSIQDWLGRTLALVPPLVLRARLEPSPYGAPLRWLDSNGDPAVVLRTWRVRGRGSDIESHTTIGCDLLMRADLMHALELAQGLRPIRELQRVRRRDIATPLH